MKKRNLLLIFMISCALLSVTNVYAAGECEGVFGAELLEEIKKVLRLIQIAAPVALLFLTSLDFAKVIFNDNKDGIDKAKNNFLKRAVAVMIIFFAPMIVTLILDIVQENSLRGCIDSMK